MPLALLDTDILSEVLKQKNPTVVQRAAAYFPAVGLCQIYKVVLNDGIVATVIWIVDAPVDGRGAFLILGCSEVRPDGIRALTTVHMEIPRGHFWLPAIVVAVFVEDASQDRTPSCS